MNFKKMIFASLAAFVALNGVGAVWHLVLFKSFYDVQQAAVTRAEILMPMLLIVDLLRGILFAYIYPLGYKGGNPASQGLKFGCLMGLVSGLHLAVYFTTLNIPAISWAVVEVLFCCIQGAIAGLLIGLIYGAKKTAA
jgi:hypothetical protein